MWVVGGVTARHTVAGGVRVAGGARGRLPAGSLTSAWATFLRSSLPRHGSQADKGGCVWPGTTCVGIATGSTRMRVCDPRAVAVAGRQGGGRSGCGQTGRLRLCVGKAVAGYRPGGCGCGQARRWRIRLRAGRLRLWLWLRAEAGGGAGGEGKQGCPHRTSPHLKASSATSYARATMTADAPGARAVASAASTATPAPAPRKSPAPSCARAS
jgi:hypothetical protein